MCSRLPAVSYCFELESGLHEEKMGRSREMVNGWKAIEISLAVVSTVHQTRRGVKRTWTKRVEASGTQRTQRNRVSAAHVSLVRPTYQKC